jgi:DNA-binding SARP family transcriptional activator
VAHLALALLGPFEAALDDKPVKGLSSDHLRALLAYLAIEGGREHARASVASLLWPERSDVEALSALRHALSNLRFALGDRPASRPFILTSRISVQFNRTSDHWLDVAEFDRLQEQNDAKSLEQAAVLYRGTFLEGLSLAESAAFDEWVLLKSEAYRRSALSLLGQLAALQTASANYEEAARWARRQLELEPYREQAHRQLMLALALGGDRTAALAHYEVCQRLLVAELGCTPDDKTQALYDQLRSGNLPQPTHYMPTLRVEPTRPTTSTTFSSFVARERQMERLRSLLGQALAGQGGVALVAGEAGAGKSALLDEITRMSTIEHENLIVLRGGCNAHAGAGDPYLPFREILQTLAGDVEGKRAGGTLSLAQVQRVWEALPVVGAALVAQGPGLIDTFVPGEALLRRAEGFPDTRHWVGRLRQEVRLSDENTVPLAIAASRPDLFAQFTQLLHVVSLSRPLLLLVDDLQWADGGTTALLFHLGRRLAGSRILLVCAYRPRSLAAGEDNGPGEPGTGAVIQELWRQWGNVVIDLDQADGREFVDAYIDGEPNRLGEGFREALFRHTGGNPLFTVELMRSFQQSGTLVRDGDGHWLQGPGLEWGGWPPHVEAVIAGRLAALPEEDQVLLQAASVQGEQFNAEVLASVLDWSETTVVRRLSGPLTAQRLVGAVRVDRLAAGRQRLSTYRFHHSLFQQYLYEQLDSVELAKLHELVGAALEEVYREDGEPPALELARHSEAAGQFDRAARYLLQAGRCAMEVAAHPEAVYHFRRGLDLLASSPSSPERDRLELDLQLALGTALFTTEGMGSDAQLLAYRRAHELGQRLREQRTLWPALHALASSSTARGDYEKALELGNQLLELARRSAEPPVLALAHLTIGATMFASGRTLPRAREHLEEAIRHYEECDDRWRQFLTRLNLFDLGVNARAWLATVLRILGYAEQARRRSEESMAQAQELDHLMSQVLACYAAGHAYLHEEDDRALSSVVNQLDQLVAGKQLLVGEVWSAVFGGWLLVRAGEVEAGLTRMREGTEAWLRTGAVFGATAQLSLLAEARLLAGAVDEGLEAVDTALALVALTDARPNEAELYRLRGELFMARGDEAGAVRAEGCLWQAIKLARAGEQKYWELRATTRLARLWRQRGRGAEAFELLGDIYDWFAEGLETAELRAAKALLEELSPVSVGGSRHEVTSPARHPPGF